MPGRLTGVSSRATRGVFKSPRAAGSLVAGTGLEGDFHARGGKRQVSLLRQKTIDALPIGTVLAIGATARLEVTERREPCRNVDGVARGLRKAIEGRAGVLARVVTGGEVKPGDAVDVVAAR